MMNVWNFMTNHEGTKARRSQKTGVFSVAFSLCACVGMFCFTTTTAAQALSAPIILWVAGDLYAADADNPSALPERLTDDGTISTPTLAVNTTYPDGVIAVKLLAPVARAALDRVTAEGFIADYDLPADIALYDIAARTLTPIATQPADASLFVDGVPDRALVRSAPAWSPDRTRLAWTEFNFGANIAQIIEWDGTQTRVVYDLFTEGERTTDVLPNNDGFMVRLASNASGDQMVEIAGRAVLGNAEVMIRPDESESIVTFAWVTDRQIGVLFSSGRWLVFDGTFDGIGAPTTPPALSVSAPNSLALDFRIDPDLGMYWETRDPSNPAAVSGAFPGKPGEVALSPDGRRIAFTGYPSFGGAAIWQDGNVTPLAGTGIDGLIIGAILWGDMRWNG